MHRLDEFRIESLRNRLRPQFQVSETLFIGFIYATIAPTATSDVIRPSHANRNNLRRPDQLHPVDIAFLSALYGPDIEPGMPFARAKPILVDAMAAHLRSK